MTSTNTPAALPLKAIQPTTGTVHFAARGARTSTGYTHIVSACSTMSWKTSRYSLSVVADDTEVTCRKCLAGHEAAQARKADLAVQVKDSSGHALRTPVAIRNEMTRKLEFFAYYGGADDLAEAHRMFEALTGIDADMASKAWANATKKYAKQGGNNPIPAI